MKINFVKDYASIKGFNSFELPGLTVLTGLNGSGKSHLLEAIQDGAVSLEGFRADETVFFNASTFYLEAETDLSEASIIGERVSIWSNFTSKGISEKTLRENWLGESAVKIKELSAVLSKSLYSLTSADFGAAGLAPMFDSYRNYLSKLEGLFQELTQQQSQFTLDGIKRTVYLTNKWINDITQEDIREAYVPQNFRNQLLQSQLGKVFVNYYDKWRENRENDFYNKEDRKTYPVISWEEFVRRHGEPPWEIVNRILKKFASLDYSVNFPDRLERKMIFRLKLLSKSLAGLEIGFENLSSGEKTMLALVSCMYRASSDTVFPKVLLLDEIDSSLHPSMTSNLFEVLNDIFVKEKGMNVILVTHSPSTVALAPAESIYVMNKAGIDRVVKATPEDALGILTEGFASLTVKESTLRLNYVLRKSSLPVVLTEGITDRIILETAWKKLYGTELPFDVQDYFDANSLRVLFKREDVFVNYPSRRFISVFDFDESGFENWAGLENFEIVESDPRKGLLKKHKSKNGHSVLLPVPTNKIQEQVIRLGNDTFESKAHMPIELLFWGVPGLDSHFNEEPQPGRGSIWKFVGDKSHFAENVVSTLPKEAFKHFELLFETIKSILK